MRTLGKTVSRSVSWTCLWNTRRKHAAQQIGRGQHGITGDAGRGFVNCVSQTFVTRALSASRHQLLVGKLNCIWGFLGGFFGRCFVCDDDVVVVLLIKNEQNTNSVAPIRSFSQRKYRSNKIEYSMSWEANWAKCIYSRTDIRWIYFQIHIFVLCFSALWLLYWGVSLFYFLLFFFISSFLPFFRFRLGVGFAHKRVRLLHKCLPHMFNRPEKRW